MGLQVLLRKKHTHRKAISFNYFSNNTVYRHSLRLFFLKGFSVKEKDSMLKFKTNQHFLQKEVGSDTKVSSYGRHDPACFHALGCNSISPLKSNMPCACRQLY